MGTALVPLLPAERRPLDTGCPGDPAKLWQTPLPNTTGSRERRCPMHWHDACCTTKLCVLCAIVNVGLQTLMKAFQARMSLSLGCRSMSLLWFRASSFSSYRHCAAAGHPAPCSLPKCRGNMHAAHLDKPGPSCHHQRSSWRLLGPRRCQGHRRASGLDDAGSRPLGQVPEDREQSFAGMGVTWAPMGDLLPRSMPSRGSDVFPCCYAWSLSIV